MVAANILDAMARADAESVVDYRPKRTAAKRQRLALPLRLPSWRPAGFCCRRCLLDRMQDVGIVRMRDPRPASLRDARSTARRGISCAGPTAAPRRPAGSGGCSLVCDW